LCAFVVQVKETHTYTLIGSFIDTFCLLNEKGMYNALTGMGGAGQADTTAADNSATALAVTFTLCSLIGAPL
jgi:hypothetical protein